MAHLHLYPVSQLNQPKPGAAVPASASHMQQPHVPQVFYPPAATRLLSQPNFSPTAEKKFIKEDICNSLAYLAWHNQ